MIASAAKQKETPRYYVHEVQSPVSLVGPDYPVLPEIKLPAKYADPKTAGLIRTIEKKDNSFNFDLTD